MAHSTSSRAPAPSHGDPSAGDRIVEAARVAFGTNGFHATTTRDIAAAAGMSPAGVYVRHASKEALLYALCRQGHEDTLTELTAAVDGAATPTEQLRALMHAFVLREAEHHTTARIVNYELEALAPEHRAEIDTLRRQIQALTLRVVTAGVESGEFDCDQPELTAIAIMGMGIDVSRWFRSERTWSAEHVAQQHADLALRMVGARG